MPVPSMKAACSFGVLRYLHDPVAQESVNIGVVVVSPEARYFRAMCTTSRSRIMAFDTFFGDTLEDMIDSDFEIYKKIKDDPNFGALFRVVMYRRIAGVLQSRAAAV